MDLFGLVPEKSDDRLRTQVELEIAGWLKDSSFDADAKILRRLSDLGIRGRSVVKSLAQVKSLQKYKYALNPQSLDHILDLAQSQPTLQKLIQGRSYLLAKVAMIYEHAPAYLFGGNASQKDLDECLLDYTNNYTSKFWEYSVQLDGEPLTSPHRVLTATFWDNELWHPAAYLKKAYRENIQGVEYYIDFHPFNLNKLLPEDFGVAQRDLIREWIERGNMKLSIHSAIVGPWPDVTVTQFYYDPTNAVDIQKETVLLARDIGASSVVLHLVDPTRLSELAEIIETASESEIRVTLENYYETEKINQTSGEFIAVLESLIPLLTKRTRDNNFGVTFDPGHYNIEGDDPIVAALRVGKWCKEKGIQLAKVHATTNYGPLRSFPPNFGSDVHDRLSTLGIDNRRIIQLIRSIGHSPVVTAEQIKPVIERDVVFIDSAYQEPIEGDYQSIVQRGKDLLVGKSDDLITPADAKVEAYQFIAGLSGVEVLQRYLVVRHIQSTENMTAETAQAATQSLMKASVEVQRRAMIHLPEILKSAIEAAGGVSQSSIRSICERLNDALLAEIHREDLNAIFAETVEYQAGETICREGTIGDEMFYIKDGQVDVFVGDLQIAALDPGNIFGEMSLFGIPRSATVKAAANDTTVGVLKKGSLVTSFKGKKHPAKTILLRLYSILPERLRNLNAKYAHARQTLQSLDPSSMVPSGDDDIDDSSEFDTSFEMMNQKELEALFNEDRVYPPGEVVFYEDTSADGAYLVKSGFARAIRRDLKHHDFQFFEMLDPEELEKIFARDQFYTPSELVSREEMLLARIGRGNIIGEMALIDESDRSATIVSEGATLGFLSKEAFDQIMKTDVDLSYKLLLTLCSTMLSRISKLNRAYLQVVSEIRRHSQTVEQPDN